MYKYIFPLANSIDKYTLQFTGELSYLDGDNELIAFRDIRRYDVDRDLKGVLSDENLLFQLSCIILQSSRIIVRECIK